MEQSSWLEGDEGETGTEMDNQSVVREKRRGKECRGPTCRSRESVLLSAEVHSSSSHSLIAQGSDVCLLQLEMLPSVGSPLWTSLTLQIIGRVCLRPRKRVTFYLWSTFKAKLQRPSYVLSRSSTSHTFGFWKVFKAVSRLCWSNRDCSRGTGPRQQKHSHPLIGWGRRYK